MLSIKQIIALVLATCIVSFFAFRNYGDAPTSETPAAIQQPKEPTKTDAFIISQNFVKDYLVSPSSADFPFADEAQISQKSGGFLVKCSFEAVNKFNAKLKQDYICELRYAGGEPLSKQSWRLIFLTIDGEIAYVDKEARDGKN